MRCWMATDEPLPTATSTMTAPTPMRMPEHRQRRAQLVGRDAADGDANALGSHVSRAMTASGGRRRLRIDTALPPRWSTCRRAGPRDGALVARPRGRRGAGSTRLAHGATSSSWVMSTIVRPSWLSCENSCMISWVDAVSRLPVGSSAQQRGPGRSRGRGRRRPVAAGRPRARTAGGAPGRRGPPTSRAASARVRRSLRFIAGIGQRELDVGQRRGAGDEVEALEDEADLAVADLRASCVLVEGAHVDAVELEPARGSGCRGSR